MTSCLMSSMKELLVLRIEGAIDALEEANRESWLGLFMLDFWNGLGGDGFSVIAIVTCARGADAAENAGLSDLK